MSPDVASSSASGGLALAALVAVSLLVHRNTVGAPVESITGEPVAMSPPE